MHYTVHVGQFNAFLIVHYDKFHILYMIFIRKDRFLLFTWLSVLYRYSEGPSSYHIWLNNLQCDSQDTFLANCPHTTDGDSRCTHSEDVGLACARRASCSGEYLII